MYIQCTYNLLYLIKKDNIFLGPSNPESKEICHGGKYLYQ